MQIRKLQNIINIERPVEYGDDLNYLALIVRDSRKELKAQFDLTKVGEQKINFILDSISQALVVIDSNYRIIMFNKKASEIFGVAKEEADEKSFEVLSKAKFLEGNVSMVIQTLRSFVYQEKIDGRIYQCNINPIDYSWTRVNEKPGASLLMIDITEEYNSSAMKREFFTNASHELKTPLTAILGYQQMMQQGVETSEEGRKELVSKTIKEATRMRKIIFDMLELSSLENESLRTVEKINVVSEIDNVLSSLDFEITQKHLTIEKNYSDMVLEINYDDFNRLIKNLLENAIFYNKENGKIFIVVDNFNKTISIADSGIGISEENINRIFERFFRVDKARSRRDGGTGLGLAIVKHICEYYGYEISVKSKIDEGSKFTITCK
jgi:two-component system phosphate regulon sensor histidine kinase PhoR